jgi:predicted oxidoreductase
MKMQKLGRYEISEIVYGSWRVVESNLSNEDMVKFLHKLIDLGINAIDTADIYGGKYHESERKIGDAFRLDPSLKDDFRIITKTGIIAGERSELPYYENQYDYIIESVKDSIDALNVNKIDILLLHRPDLFADFRKRYDKQQDEAEQENIRKKKLGIENFKNQT